MSYDFNLYLKHPPVLSAESFGAACKAFQLKGELAPDFTLDGSISPLCCKLSGILPDDSKAYLAVVDYIYSETDEETTFEPLAPRKKWWQFKRPKGEPIVLAAGSQSLLLSVGIDSLDKPLALLIAYALSGEDGLLENPQTGRFAVGQTAVGEWVTEALNELHETAPDRLLLHEFEEFI